MAPVDSSALLAGRARALATAVQTTFGPNVGASRSFTVEQFNALAVQMENEEH